MSLVLVRPSNYNCHAVMNYKGSQFSKFPFCRFQSWLYSSYDIYAPTDLTNGLTHIWYLDKVRILAKSENSLFGALSPN